MNQVFIIKEARGKIQSPEDLFKKITKFNIDYNQEKRGFS